MCNALGYNFISGKTLSCVCLLLLLVVCSGYAGAASGAMNRMKLFLCVQLEINE